MKKDVRTILLKKSKGRNRNRAIEAGAYDGRFLTQVVPDKKRSLHKKYRKNKHKIFQEAF